jgi:Fe-S oxidoreductase
MPVYAQLAAFLLVTGYALYLFGHVVASRIRFIRLGRPSDLPAAPAVRWRRLAAGMLGHRTLLKDARSGLMHLVMFYGFIILQFGAIDLIGKGLAPGWHLPLGAAYPAFRLLQDLTVFLVLLAAGYAGYRRYVEKLPRLKRGWKAGVVLMFIGGLMLSVLLSQGAERIWKGESPSWGQPFSSLVSGLFAGAGEAAAGGFFYLFWWVHLLILLSFLVYVPQSKHAHLLFAPVNVFLRKIGAPGKLAPIDFADESAESYGVGKIEDFTRAQLIDLYACVECGRCTSVCPASATGKLLSPMHLITNLRDHLTAKGAAVTSRSPWMPAFAFAGSGGEEESRRELAGDVVTETELWACTTCRNCEEVCPVGNEHVDKIVGLRRYLVLTEGRLPAEAGRMLANLERQGNPWGLSRSDRAAWLDGLEPPLHTPLVQDGGPFEYLFHVGSMGSYDNRAQRVAGAMIRLMNHAGISFAVFGGEEGNSGDTARRIGNEYLYQQLAMENVERFVRHGVRKIVTIDPHAYHTFKNEYRDFGLPEDVEVYHHTELLAQWVKEGRIKPDKLTRERIVYHDPCYLGRHNGVYGDPREILRSIPGVELVEMERHGADSMCCGAGGGLMWMEEKEGSRINTARTEQALSVKPTVIGTACPYCLTMLSDGTKAMEADERVKTMDVAEILAGAVAERV